ncbi:MAG: hypothetical protein OXC53_11130 [Rhodobacteraceae bacterium]|nr:hypothetical protein [Paracoccaceae bacterium]
MQTMEWTIVATRTTDYEFAKWLKKTRRLLFWKMETPWSFWWRFFIVCMGTFTYAFPFSYLLFFRGFEYIIPNIGNLLLIFLGSAFFLSIFFAWIIALRPTSAGPVRLYLAGVTLPAAVVFIIRISMLGFGT